jgi:GT2 family glycosyltransferase
VTAISVVIPTHDRPDGLRRTLDGLSRQTHRDFRVVVVDDAGRRPAGATLRGRSYPFDHTVVTLQQNGGPARARNRGVAESDGARWIAFLDDDVVPIPEFLARHLRAWDEGGPGAVVIGPQLAPADWRPTPWNRWEAERLAVEYGRMEAGQYQPTWRQFFTGNAFLERDAFVAAGGFDEQFTRAEDIEFAYRLHRQGARFVFEPNAVGWHYAHRSLSSWRDIPRQYARFDLAIARRNPDMGWMETVDQELAARNPATRAACAVTSRLALERAAATAATAAAISLNRVGGRRLTSQLLSLAFSLEYTGSRRAAQAEEARGGPGVADVLSTEPPRLTDTFHS